MRSMYFEKQIMKVTGKRIVEIIIDIEKEGKEKEFQNKIKNGEFLEHENIHNNFYGTSQQRKENGSFLKQDAFLTVRLSISDSGVSSLTLSCEDTVLSKFIIFLRKIYFTLIVASVADIFKQQNC